MIAFMFGVLVGALAGLLIGANNAKKVKQNAEATERKLREELSELNHRIRSR